MMEGFDKLINEISQNASGIIPKRLSFEFLSESSISQRLTKKRKISETEYQHNDTTIFGSSSRNATRADETLNSSNGSTSVCNSWETKLLRSDLLEAQCRIAQLKKEIQHQNTIQSELELKFSAKEKALQTERDHFKSKNTEYERILRKNRNNDKNFKEELIKGKNQLNIQKLSFDKQLTKLQSENDRLQDELNWKVNDLNNNIGQLTRDNDEIYGQLSTAEEELEALRLANEGLKEKLEEYKTQTSEIEQARLDLQNAEMRIKELEYEVASYADWKELSKASQSRMSNMSDIEKETQRLRQTNKNLHDSLGNKLLLEEKVHDLEVRLKKYEQNNVDSIALKVQLEALEKELKDWKHIGADYCQKGDANNPINLRNYIEQLLHRDLLLISEKSSVSTEKSTIQKQLSDFKTQHDTSQKQIETLKKSLKNHQSILSKLQKKLLLVSAERDSQRQLLENYEKDLTITQGIQNTIVSTETQQNRIRIEMLEKTVSGYKDLCAKLEQELSELKGNPDSDSIGNNSEQYETIRKDLDALRAENEKLKKRKNELEIEIENLTLRSNVMDDDRIKVVHMKINPTSIAQEQVANEIIKLRAELERLKIRNRKLEAGNDELTTRLNETVNMTINIKQMQTLQDDHKSLQAKYKEMEQVFSNVNQELREVIYMLFGFKLDRYGSSNYRITSMYADTEQDELLFQLNSTGTLDMLETEYSKTLDTFMDQYLRSANGSLPGFMSALTLDLINRCTMTVTSS